MYDILYIYVHKDPQTKHNPPKYQHPPLVQCWLMLTLWAFTETSRIANKVSDSRQPVPPLGEGSFCSLSFSRNVTFYSLHIHDNTQLKYIPQMPIQSIQLPIRATSIHPPHTLPTTSPQHTHKLCPLQFPSRLPLNLHSIPTTPPQTNHIALQTTLCQSVRHAHYCSTETYRWSSTLVQLL